MRGLLVIGHGSRRDEANATVREVARLLTTPDRAVASTSDMSDRATALVPDLATTSAPDRTVTDSHLQVRWHAVEPAFLEVVQPDIIAGYGNLAAAGCTEIVVHPFFLFDGNHTSRDIPAALVRARERFPHTRWTLTAPLGLHPGVLTAVTARIDDALTDRSLAPSGPLSSGPR